MVTGSQTSSYRDSGWLYGCLFGLHFMAIGLAWIPLFTRLRLAYGQQAAAICGLGPAMAAVLNLLLFMYLESRPQALNRGRWLMNAEIGLAACYFALSLILSDPATGALSNSEMRPTNGVVLLPLFIAMGICQSAANVLITSIILSVPSSERLPRYRAFGSFTYALVAISLGRLIWPEHSLMLASGAAISTAILSKFAYVPQAFKQEPRVALQTVSSVAIRKPIPWVLIAPLALMYFIGASEQFYVLYAHEFVTNQFGAQGATWIGIGVLLEVCVLFLYPGRYDGWRRALFLVHPIAWTTLYYCCTWGVTYAPFLAFAILLQGFNCAGFVALQRRFSRFVPSVTGQAAIVFAQGSGSLTASFLDGFVLGKGTAEVWPMAFVFSLLAIVAAIVFSLYQPNSQLAPIHEIAAA